MKLSDLLENEQYDSSYKSVDNTLSLNESVLDNGIENLEPGLLCVLNFTNRVDDGKSNKIQVHGLIVAKTLTNPETDPWPVYDVYFWTNYNSGEYSGAILIKDLCIWRYMASVAPSEKFLKSVKKGELDDLVEDPNSLHYFNGDKKIYINKDK